MLGLQHHGHDETVIVDVDAVDRKEDLTVQVRLIPEGDWHRKAIGGETTACGDPLGNETALREEVYAGNICDRCFTAYERGQITAVLLPSRTKSR